MVNEYQLYMQVKTNALVFCGHCKHTFFMQMNVNVSEAGAGSAEGYTQTGIAGKLADLFDCQTQPEAGFLVVAHIDLVTFLELL